MNLEAAFTSAKSCVAPALVMVEETVSYIGDHLDKDLDRGHSRHLDSYICRSLLRAGQALDSADLLASRYRYQDIWVLCRVLCELVINTCYLQIASDLEFSRWSNFDLWTDERLFSNLSAVVPSLEHQLDPVELKRQKEQRRTLEERGLYKDIRSGFWSEKSLEQRGQAVDRVLNLEQDIFLLLCRLTVKVGNSFVHGSPKGVGSQTTPITSKRQPSPEDIQGSTQALSMSITAVYAGVNFTRVRKGLAEHPLAPRFGDALRVAFDGTKPP